MKRLPLVFLSLFILVTCLLIGGWNAKIGKAAPDRAIPWWFGDEDYFYSEYECRDGMALWVTNPEGPYVRVMAELVLNGSILFDETFTMVKNHPDGAYNYYGEYTLDWPQELDPGSKIRLHIDTYKKKPNGFQYPEINLWIEDCKLPGNPQPSELSLYFEGGTPTTSVNQCDTYEFSVDPYDYEHDNSFDLPISDLDVAFLIGSAPAAHLSATLESPSGTRVKLIDKNHKPSFRMGTTCSDFDYALPDFVLDDDSIYSLINGDRPFNRTSFSPFPDSLSAFSGELATGTWKLELCNYEAPAAEQVYVGRNGNFEEGTVGWVRSSSTGRDLIYSHSTTTLPVTPHNGQWLAWLGGVNDEISRIEQIIRPPSILTSFDPVLQFWYQIRSSDSCYNDLAYLVMNDEVLEEFNLCSSTATTSWIMHEIDLGDLGYQSDWSIREESVFEVVVETSPSSPSSFFIDDLGWDFNNPGSEVSCMLMDFTAESSTPQYTLTVSNNGQGTIQISPANSVYDSGQIVTLTAVPDDGYTFTGWSGDASGTANPIQITMNGNKSVAASFAPVEPDTYTLETPTSGGGIIIRNPNQTVYQSGQVVTLTADPDDGYVFTGWSGDASGTANPIQITMDSNKSVTTFFELVEPDTYTLETPTSGGGIILRNPDQTVYQSGQVVTLTADPDDGYVFTGWSGDASGTANPIQITMNGNKSVTASFTPVAPNTYTLNTPSSAGGSIDRNPDKQTYQSGEVVTLTAVPANGYQFGGWNGDASGLETPIQITMDSNKSVGATFTPIGSSDGFINFMPLIIR